MQMTTLKAIKETCSYALHSSHIRISKEAAINCGVAPLQPQELTASIAK